MALLQSERIAAFSCPLGPDVLALESFSATEELGRPFECTVELRSEEPDISAADLVGKPVSVRLNTRNSGKRYFHGHVSSFKKTNKDGIHQSYSATFVPWTWFLQQTSNCRIFQKKSIPDILQKVFQAHGFSDFESRLSDPHTPWEYCVQYRESDLNFIDRLAQQEGIYYYFRHEEQKHTMVLCDSPGAHEPFPNYESVSFRPPGQHVEADEHVREWISETRHRPGKFTFKDYNFTRPRTNLETRAQIIEPYALSDLEVYDYPGEYEQASDGEAWARIRMEEINSQVDVKSGWADARGLSVGSTFKLTEIPDPSAEGKYLITATQITFDTGVYQTGELGAGEVFRCQFNAISADKTFRPEWRTKKRLIQGVQTAVVTGPAGEKIYTDKYGRVKVQFHWDREGKKDADSSCWIRVSQPWGGKDWGGMFIPHVGQEVVVSFEEGDPDRPLITGRVYNPDQMPPIALPAGKTKSVIRDHGGNEIVMEGAGEQQLKLYSPHANSQITLGGPGSGIRLTTDKDWDSKISGNKEELVLGYNKTKIISFSLEHLIGANTKIVVGWKHESVVGAETKTNAGNKTELIAGSQIKVHRGTIVELKGSARQEKVPKHVRAIGYTLSKIGEYKAKIAKGYNESIAGRTQRKMNDLIEKGQSARINWGIRQEDIDELKTKVDKYSLKASQAKLKADEYKILAKMDVANGAFVVKS